MLDETFEPREGIEPDVDGLAEHRRGAGVAHRARVDLTRARPLGARGPARRCEELTDGAVIVELPFAGDDWLAREILKEAGDAVVLEPEDARDGRAGRGGELAGARRRASALSSARLARPLAARGNRASRWRPGAHATAACCGRASADPRTALGALLGAAGPGTGSSAPAAEDARRASASAGLECAGARSPRDRLRRAAHRGPHRGRPLPSRRASAVGQDRGWQLELYRRIAAGGSREFAGAEGLRADRADAHASGCARRGRAGGGHALDAAPRDMLDGLRRGRERRARAARGAAARAPAAADRARSRWSAVDSLALGKMLALGFSTNMETELFRAELVALIGRGEGGPARAAVPGGNPIVTAPGTPGRATRCRWPGRSREVREALGLAPLARRARTTGRCRASARSPARRCWPATRTSPPRSRTSGTRSSSRRPASSCAAARCPASPGVVIGQSRDVAWSFTNVMADVQDLFVERVARPRRQPAYLFEGEWRPLDRAPRGDPGARARASRSVLEVRETHHGPIVNDPLGAERGEPLALAWTALREPFFTALGLDAGDVRDGRGAGRALRGLRTCPCMNMVWADSSAATSATSSSASCRAGAAAARTCRSRAGPASTSGTGYVPYDELPRARRPRGGRDRDRQQPDRAGRLPAPHHERVPRRLPRRAHRAAAGRARAPLARRLRADAGDVFSIPGAETAAPAARGCAPREPARGARDRAAEELGPPARPRHRGRHDLQRASRSISPALVSEAAIGDPADAARWRSKSLLGFTADDVVAVALPRAPARAVGRGRRGAGGRPLLGRAGARVARRRARPSSRSASAPTRPVALGRRARRCASRTRSARASSPFERCSTGSCRARLPRRRRPGDRERDRLRAARGDYTGAWAPVLPAARRPRRPAALPLAAHDRPVRAARQPRTTTTCSRTGSRAATNPSESPRAAAARTLRLELLPDGLPPRPDQDDRRRAARLPRRAEGDAACATIGPNGRPHLMPLWYVPDGVRAARLDLRQVAEGEEPRARPARHAADRGRRGVPGAARRDVRVRRRDRARARRGRRRSARRCSTATAGGARARRRGREMVREQAAKRVGLRFTPTRIVTWDHRKLGGTY